MNKSELHNLLDIYIESSFGNEKMENRLNEIMRKNIPESLIGLKKDNEYDSSNKTDCKKREFIERFLYTNRYYYCPIPDFFISYDGKHFKTFNEDDIHHQILTTITSQRTLMNVKEEIKNSIIDSIRQRTPLNAIPESVTIQSILDDLYPKFFPSKNTAKYFLTIIGDILLNKSLETRIFITNVNLRNLIDEIIYQSNTFFGGQSTFQSIKYKYHGYNYNLCRLIKTNDSSKTIEVPNQLSRNMLDLLCVAAHYSTRFSGSDNFIKQCFERDLQDHALYLQNNNVDEIIEHFIGTMLEAKKDGIISKKNMFYLWKVYLKGLGIPNIVLNDILRIKLNNLLEFNNGIDAFLNVTSKHLPVISKFLDFWNETIEVGDDELEINEITCLFQNWQRGKKHALSDLEIADFIRHYFPDFTIYNNKYITGIKSSEWDKHKIVKETIIEYDNKFIKNNQKKTRKNPGQLSNVNFIISDLNTTYSLYQVYEYYCLNTKTQPIIGKRYFEDTARRLLGTLIDKDDIITTNNS